MKMAGQAGAVEPRPWVKVWDPFVRIFHWSLVVSFFTAYLLGDDGGTWHQVFGYIALGLVGLRLVWGVIGSRHARFADFIPSPRRLLAYAKDVVAHREARHLGHNPAGAVMVVALLLMVVALGITGWLQTTDAFWGSELLDHVHAVLADITLGLVALHVAGVVFTSLRHHENLIRSMFTGRKRDQLD